MFAKYLINLSILGSWGLIITGAVSRDQNVLIAGVAAFVTSMAAGLLVFGSEDSSLKYVRRELGMKVEDVHASLQASVRSEIAGALKGFSEKEAALASLEQRASALVSTLKDAMKSATDGRAW